MTAGIAYPADYNATYSGPQYTANQGRTALAAAMAGATSTRPLGGFSGVRPGTPSNTVSATSTTWTAAAFGGYIDTAASATNGGYYFSFPSGGTGSVTAAAASARIDIVYVQLSDTNTGDGTLVAPRVDILYLAGTAGSGVAPTTPARSFAIAQINVPATGGGSPTVTWVAPYTAAAGAAFDVNTSSTLAALTSYPRGTRARGLDALADYVFDGTNWRLPSSRVAMIPTSVDNGTKSFGGYVTSTATSSVSVNGCFTSEFDAYEITFDITTASAAALNITLRAGGSDAPSGYDTQRKTASSTTDAAAQTLNASNWVGSGGIGIVGGRHVGKIALFDPAKAAGTFGKIESNITANPMTTSSALFWGGLVHRTASAYDGITFTASTGNLTVNEIRIEGISRA